MYVPADVFARYQRLRGYDVLMVSGTDAHGTPVTVRADQEGITPAEVAARYHAEFLTYWRDLGISYDLYTTTTTDNHREVVQDEFMMLLDKGYLYQGPVDRLLRSGGAALPARHLHRRRVPALPLRRARAATSARTAAACSSPKT